MEASDKFHASAVLFPFAELRYSLHMNLGGEKEEVEKRKICCCATSNPGILVSSL